MGVRGLPVAVLACVLVAAQPSARAELRGPRDVARAVTALSSDVPELRARAADWLALHGPDAVAVPALLTSLEREQAPVALVAVARALARRARPEDAARLIEIEPRLRTPARGLVIETLAQLETPETDAWLVGWLADGAGGDLRETLEVVREIARGRRERLLPLALERLAREPTLGLAVWVASLHDERARPALLALTANEPRLVQAALGGLAELGPDPATAARLRELGPGPSRTVAFVRALAAAEPGAPELDAALVDTDADLRAALLETLVVRAPERALSVLGEDPTELAPGDRFVVRLALEQPSPPLVPWLRAHAADPGASTDEREAALDALLAVAPCEGSLPAGPDEIMPLAHARRARFCGGAPSVDGPSPAATLHLRAIAGQDVGSAIRASLAGAGEEERLTLAHAWLASATLDDGPAAALAHEPSAEVFAVLAAAAARAARPVDPAALVRWLEEPATRAAALSLVPLAHIGGPSDAVLARAVRRALGDPDPQVLASALRVAGSVGVTSRAHACRALEHEIAAVRRAAWAALGPDAPCLLRRARVDAPLRAHLRLAGEPAALPPREDALVLRVTGPPGASRPRVGIVDAHGRWTTLRPPPSGLVYVPGAAPADVRVLLERPVPR